MTRVFADTREQVEVPDEFEERELPAGDYAIEGLNEYGEEVKLLVERKEWAELVNAFRSGSLFNQIGRMLDQDHDPWLVIEGNRNDAYTYANARRGEVRRFLSSIMYKMDIRVYQSNSTSDTHNFIKDLADWIEDDGSGAHSVRDTKKVPEENRPQYILEGLPSVGPSRAQDLLDEFGSAYGVLTAEPEDLKEVDGIGDKTAESIYEAVRFEH